MTLGAARGGYEFDIPFSRQQLADYLGVERSGLSLELGKMRDEGLLNFHKSHFLLQAPETDGFLLLRVKNLPFKPLCVLESADTPAECWAFTEGERNYEPAEIDK